MNRRAPADADFEDDDDLPPQRATPRARGDDEGPGRERIAVRRTRLRDRPEAADERHAPRPSQLHGRGEGRPDKRAGPRR